MVMSLEWIFAIVFVLLMIWGCRNFLRQKRKNYLNNAQFDQVLKKVAQHYPHLSREQLDLVMDGLRIYFQACQRFGPKAVAMPSQIVDVAWHEFILFTKDYATFCNKAFGYFLHHTPSEAMKSPTEAQFGIQRIWQFSCKQAYINPTEPTRLPLLFAIDKHLKIENGFYYTLNCMNKKITQSVPLYCASHIGGFSGGWGGGCASGCSS